MPAILAHHLFGEALFDDLPEIVGKQAVVRKTFLLGNQGPDPLLCLKALPAKAPFRNVGTVMHTNNPSRLLNALHEHFIGNPRGSYDLECRAFALGFLCHYLLDSTAHPLVFAQQFALCEDDGHGIIPQEARRAIHTLIETELDEYVLFSRRGLTVESYSPHREVLSCPDGALLEISGRLSSAVSQALEVALPRSAYAASVHLYRAAQAALDSKREGLRRHLDYARLAGKAFLHIQAFTHHATIDHEPPFTNNDHVAWPHPFQKGETVSTSFDELFEAAYKQALDKLPRYSERMFSLGDCATITRGVDFYGRPVSADVQTS